MVIENTFLSRQESSIIGFIPNKLKDYYNTHVNIKHRYFCENNIYLSLVFHDGFKRLFYSQ